MPFKIVQTIERGKKFLSCVPDAWEESNNLLWPRKGSKKLQKNEDSRPGDDWISSPCTVKRRLLTYEEAQAELQNMQQKSDTEDGASTSNRRNVTSHININLNELASQCFMDKENIAPVDHDAQSPAPVTTKPQEGISVILEEPTEQQDEETLIWLNTMETEKSNFEATVLERLQNLENGHNAILQKMSELGAQIDGFLRQVQQQKMITSLGFEAINTKEALNNFEESLKDKGLADSYKEKLMTVCGVGKGRGANNSYRLSEVMFTRQFLDECSWAGGSRSEKKKICFKAYSRVITFFFELIHNSDKKFTMIECEEFFKNILRNSGRRLTAKMLRVSATKARGKGKGKAVLTKNTGAAVSAESPNENEADTNILSPDSI